MATKRFPVPAIESYMPSVDARVSGETRIINGKNYTWDSKGPRSGFGALQLTPFPIEKPRDVQSIRIQGRSLTFTQDAILSWRSSTPQDWELLHIFSTELSKDGRFPWQVIFLGGYLYMSHPMRGFFEAESLTGQTRLLVKAKTPFDIPGLPLGVKGMLVVRGRGVLVNDEFITWTSVGDLTNLTPTLGGAGFQRIDAIVAGDYVAVTSYQQGFIVWTTKGAIIAEYTGGDEVWRFDALISQERPLSPWAVAELSSGITAMLTSHGLFYSPDAPQAWTPDFNEFFRQHVQHLPHRNFFYRLEYDLDAETVYICESEAGSLFSRTFVLKPTLNKWSTFDVLHYGMGQLAQEDFGYVRHDGIPFRFADVFFREEEPSNDLGRDRHSPLVQKQMLIPSSTFRSRALTWPDGLLGEIQEVLRPGWFNKTQFYPAEPARGTIDSFVEIGYLRDPAMNMSADAYAEFQEITIQGMSLRPSHPEDFTTSYKATFFYPTPDDWNYTGTVTGYDIAEDWMSSSGTEDWLARTGFVDWRTEVDYDLLLDPGTESQDWNLPGIAEDYAGNASAYPALTYDISIHASQDGITVEDYAVNMAKFNAGAIEYATQTSGSLHYIRIAALGIDQYFSIRGIDLTVTYGGQQG